MREQVINAAWLGAADLETGAESARVRVEERREPVGGWNPERLPTLAAHILNRGRSARFYNFQHC